MSSRTRGKGTARGSRKAVAVAAKAETRAGVPSGDDTRGDITRGDVTRTRLVDAVIASIAESGLEGTSISRVSEHAGLSRGLVSFHFDGKDKLLDAALRRAIATYEESWESNVVAPPGPPAERLHRVVDHDLDFALRAPEILALWWAAWGEARAKSIYRDASLTRDKRFVDDIAAMFRKAGTKPAAARQHAIILNACLLGFWLQHHLGETDAGLAPLRAAGHGLVEALLGAVKMERCLTSGQTPR